jgi:hypothetical protein
MLTAAERFGAPAALGIARRLLGLATGGAEGLELLRGAVASLEPSARRLELARALIDYGAALRRHEQHAAARDPLRRGLDLAQRCGKHAGATRSRRTARDRRATSQSRAHERGVAYAQRTARRATRRTGLLEARSRPNAVHHLLDHRDAPPGHVPQARHQQPRAAPSRLGKLRAPGWHFHCSFAAQKTYSAVYGTLTVSPPVGCQFDGAWPP